MHLTIIDWNMCSENKNWDTALKFLFESTTRSPDIVCLQEVPLEIVQRLEKIPGYTIATAEDFYKWKGGEKTIYYLVTMSRYTIHEMRRFTYGGVVKRLKNILKRPPYAEYKGIEEWKEFLYVDIRVGNEELRIFNVHFDAITKAWRRLTQWRKIRRHFLKKNCNILCGDLNIHDGLKVRWFNRLIGRYLFDMTVDDLSIEEKNAFEKRFYRAGLKSAIKNCVTYPSLWGSPEIDHILIPSDVHIMNAFVHRELYGSDHYPLQTIITVGFFDRSEFLRT